MAFPKKPNHLKLMSGSRQPLEPAGLQVQVLSDIPEPFDWLQNSHSVREWRRLAPILTSCKLLTDASLGSFGILCSVFGAIVQCTSGGITPKASLLAQYRALAHEFGLTPLSQSRIPIASPKKPPNPFARFKNPT